VTDDDFPFILSTGRTLSQFNAGTMTVRTGNARLHPTDVLEMAPRDALRLGIVEGEKVRLVSHFDDSGKPAFHHFP
jgi:formate dehydrogenase major subunit